MNEQLQQQILNLPERPGVYRFYNKTNELIYVGKAKSLHKRVNSYFNKGDTLSGKTKRLVSLIDYLEFTIVNTEFEALLLENSLIKQYQPRYNILLKDDKSYPFLYLSYERFPRLISTRKFDRQLGEFYGPYASVRAMKTVMDLAHRIFYLRTCSFNLSVENIAQHKFKECLEYHIGNCKAPCVGWQQEEEYLKNIDQVRNILKGKTAVAKEYLRENMNKASADMDFEKAQQYKEKLNLLDQFQSNSLVVNPDITDLEVFTIESDEEVAALNYFMIINGTIIHTRTDLIKKKLEEESDEEILLLYMVDIRSKFHSQTQEAICNIEIETELDGIRMSVPQRGDKRKLIELSLKNGQYKIQKHRLIQEEQGDNKVLEILKDDLKLKELPDHIECFDNSNIQGTHPVAAMVCFKDGKPSKKDYRHFNIKGVEGPNDFASMQEIVTRRYKRLVEENLPLPKLIVVDGGKGQLSSATFALQELGLYGKIPIVGIAKNLEEIFFPNDPYPLYIDKRSPSLRLIQYMRNEAHRFGITFHRQKRSKGSLQSELTNIPGIGEATYEQLIQHFKSLARIKKATLPEIEDIAGKAKAALIFKHFHGDL